MEMEDKIIKLLESLRLIKPDEEFKNRGRDLILNVHGGRRMAEIKTGVFSSVKFGAALALASVLMFVFIGGLSYFANYAFVADGFDAEALTAEAEQIDLKIQLGQARYSESASEVARFSEAEKDREEIDNLLDEIVL